MLNKYVIECPSCKVRFFVPVELLSAANGELRCGFCRHVFIGTHHIVDDSLGNIIDKMDQYKRIDREYSNPVDQGLIKNDNIIAFPRMHTDLEKKVEQEDKGEGVEETINKVDTTSPLLELIQEPESIEPDSHIDVDPTIENYIDSLDFDHLLQADGGIKKNTSLSDESVSAYVDQQKIITPADERIGDLNENGSESRVKPSEEKLLADIDSLLVEEENQVPKNTVKPEIKQRQPSSSNEVKDEIPVFALLEDNVTTKPTSAALEKKQEIAIDSLDSSLPKPKKNKEPPLSFINVQNTKKPESIPTSVGEEVLTRERQTTVKPLNNPLLDNTFSLTADDQDDELDVTDVYGNRLKLLSDIDFTAPIAAKKVTKRSIGWCVVSLLAIIALAVQYFYYKLPDWAEHDNYRSWVVTGCQYLYCTVPDKVDVSQVKTEKLVMSESMEYEGVFDMNSIIYNNARFTQPYPAINLKFTDTNGQVVAERQFLPHEYLSKEALKNNKMPVRTPIYISLQMLNPSAQVAGYEISFVPAPANAL